MSQDARTTRPARILVVDDDRITARLLQFHLVRSGYEVAVAHEGEHATGRARDFDPDAVVLDLDLPDVPGTEVLRRLRREDCDRRRVIMILTASLRIDQVGDFASADSVDSKPIALSSMRRRLLELRVPPQVDLHYRGESIRP